MKTLIRNGESRPGCLPTGEPVCALLGVSRRWRQGVGVALMLACSLANGRADTVSYSDSFPMTTPVWSGSLIFPQFSTALGILDSIMVSLTGTVGGLAQFENFSGAAGSTINMHQAATLTLTRPDTTPLVVTVPFADTSDVVPVFDGTLDFGGTSGHTYPNLGATLTQSVTLNPVSPSDLALFVGAGNISLPISAVSNGSTSSTGGFPIIGLNTTASASAQVTYTYHTVTPVPEPGQIAMGVLTLLGAGGWVLRQRAKTAKIA